MMNQLTLNWRKIASSSLLLIGSVCLAYSFHCFAFLSEVDLVNSISDNDVLNEKHAVRVFDVLLWLNLFPLFGLILSLILIYFRHRSQPFIKWIVLGIGAICFLAVRFKFPGFGIIYRALKSLIPALLPSNGFLISGMIFCCLGLCLILINWSNFLLRSNTVNNQQ